MALSRRGFLAGLFVAPAIIKIPGLLMPIQRQPYYVFRTSLPTAIWREVYCNETLRGMIFSPLVALDDGTYRELYRANLLLERFRNAIP